MATPEAFCARVRREYRDLPGLKLTLAQARRLWHVDAAACETMLASLVEQGFLARTADGAFVVRPPAERQIA